MLQLIKITAKEKKLASCADIVRILYVLKNVLKKLLEIFKFATFLFE